MMAISARKWPAACGKAPGNGVKADHSEREKLSGVISGKALFQAGGHLVRCASPAYGDLQMCLPPDAPEKIDGSRRKEHP
jgi:hypothetical protein